MRPKFLKKLFSRRKKSKPPTTQGASRRISSESFTIPTPHNNAALGNRNISAATVDSTSETEPITNSDNIIRENSVAEEGSTEELSEEVASPFVKTVPTVEEVKTEEEPVEEVKAEEEPSKFVASKPKMSDELPGKEEDLPPRSETPVEHRDSISTLDEPSPVSAARKLSISSQLTFDSDVFMDSPAVGMAYDSIPLLEQINLPRGGISMETQAIGHLQFGIPPETIKDSMRLGLPVPNVYIVPVERFCREMGPALGVNLAEFEFPAYFNFFVYKKRCTLIVDNYEAERNICRVFSETLLGPAMFRKEENPIPFGEQDFAPDFPPDARPDFSKELKHFRIMPDGKELVLETLLNFRHFEMPRDGVAHDNLGVPPPLPEDVVSELEESGHCADLLDDDDEDEPVEEVAVPKDLEGVESREQTNWTFAQVRWIPCSVVYPADATPEQIEARTLKRVEIFKMPGGTEYIVHDIDENNHIVGKARFSGHMKVSASISVLGFGGEGEEDEEKEADEKNDDDSEKSAELSEGQIIEKPVLPPTFHPPSFGVTVLGNSHGFDKSGSVSGYVLWINGRGVMIDPPPYSSATLEREGIRPRTIVGIILTHCHADHDAGAFQKVLTGSPVVVITTPTIYQSFIRKYAALSALSPALLRHSHRHKPAIIGEPLRFQGATFHFTYTLHTIPCVGFRVEWRGRSMVFTGDHFNSPPAIDKLQETGVLSKARADDLRNLPLQDTDLLLHEAGAPPIHTPLEVLLQLPQRVKRHLYVVHTSALPPDCELRVAPTGTAGTIRLDQMQRSHHTGSMVVTKASQPISLEDDSLYSSPWSNASSEYESIAEHEELNSGNLASSFGSLGSKGQVPKRFTARSSSQLLGSNDRVPPLVSMRPASSTDAWFILNLLSAVPFLTSLSYASTMELLETARVDAHCKDDVVVPISRRNSVLCVVWEGTCVELKADSSKLPNKAKALLPIREKDEECPYGAVWHAGDWTAPMSLQPERRLSGDSDLCQTHDIVAMSSQGVKVITVEFASLHAILKSGSALYRKYFEFKTLQQKIVAEPAPEEVESPTEQQIIDKTIRSLDVLELLDCNSALRKLSAVQKRHLECLAEGPLYFQPGERLWRAGASVDKAFIIVSGTASFAPKRRNAGSAGVPLIVRPSHATKHTEATVTFEDQTPGYSKSASLGDRMRLDALAAIKQLGPTEGLTDDSSIDSEELDARKHKSNTTTSSDIPRTALKRDDTCARAENVLAELEGDAEVKDRRATLVRRRSSRARFANKVLGRLYNRRAFTAGLVFSRGHFLGDISKMVAGLISSDAESQIASDGDGDDSSAPRYGFGEMPDQFRTESISDMVIQEQNVSENTIHSSTLAAGKDGCVVLVFPKTALIPFLDEYPGLLLSLLGTQVVV